MLSAILWDNDGVLVDTERLYFEANRDYLSGLGVELTAADFAQWFLRESRGAWHLLPDASEEQIARHRRERDQIYAARLAAEPRLVIQGMPELLGRLAPRLRMGVVTSARREHFDAIHARYDLRRHFEFVLTAESYRETKPSPEPYLLGLERLGLPSERCVAVEDSPRGLAAAVGAGLRCIVVRNELTASLALDGAFRIVDDVDELAQALDALC